MSTNQYFKEDVIDYLCKHQKPVTDFVLSEIQNNGTLMVKKGEPKINKLKQEDLVNYLSNKKVVFPKEEIEIVDVDNYNDVLFIKK